MICIKLYIVCSSFFYLNCALQLLFLFLWWWEYVCEIMPLEWYVIILLRDYLSINLNLNHLKVFFCDFSWLGLLVPHSKVYLSLSKSFLTSPFLLFIFCILKLLFPSWKSRGGPLKIFPAIAMSPKYKLFALNKRTHFFLFMNYLCIPFLFLPHRSF